MKNKYSFLMLLAAMVATMSIVSCSKGTSTPSGPTLYDSLGGTTMVTDPTASPAAQIEQGRLNIRSVVDSAIFVIAADDSINHYFAVLAGELHAAPPNTMGLKELSKNLTDFFCVGTGAKSFTYSGLSMSDAHNPAVNGRINAKIDSADFGRFVDDVVAGAHQNGLSTYQITRLGAVIYSVEGAVVQVH